MSHRVRPTSKGEVRTKFASNTTRAHEEHLGLWKAAEELLAEDSADMGRSSAHPRFSTPGNKPQRVGPKVENPEDG